MKNKIYIAMAGTFDPSIITSELIPIEYNINKPFRSNRELRKTLKIANVVIEANVEIMIKLKKKDFILVLPESKLGDLLWYRRRKWIKSEITYMYSPIRAKLFRLSIKLNKEIIIVNNKTLLNEILERNEESGN